MRSTDPQTFIRSLLGLLLLGAILAVAIGGVSWWPVLQERISDSGSWGFVLFMALFVALTTFCFPVSVLGFTAGALYGPWLGLLLIYPSGLVSGSIIFALAKGVLRLWVGRWVESDQRLQAIENLAEGRGVRLNVLTRLSPFNFGLASYGLAAGKSGYSAYLVGLLTILPSMTAQVWAGALAGGGNRTWGEEGSRLEVILLVVGILFLGILSWQVGRMIKQALDSVKTTD